MFRKWIFISLGEQEILKIFYLNKSHASQCEKLIHSLTELARPGFSKTLVLV